jgi:hypothetical protein
MKEKFDETLLKGADELINRPDREIMALSLNKNDSWAENYQMAMTIKLRSSIASLEQNIKNLKKSMDSSSQMMIILTVIIAILTVMLVFR